MLQLVNPQLQYRPDRDLLPVGQVADQQIGLVVRADSPFNKLQDVIAASKMRTINYGHSGAGTSLHLAGEQLRSRSGGQFTGVPYKSGPASMTDLIGGQLEMVFTTLAPAQPLALAKRIKIIAIVNNQRVPSLPDIPTFSESGLPGFDVNGFYGISVPAGTPQAIVEKLSSALLASVRDPVVKARLQSQDMIVVGSTPAEYKRFIDGQFKILAPMVRELKLTID